MPKDTPTKLNASRKSRTHSDLFRPKKKRERNLGHRTRIKADDTAVNINNLGGDLMPPNSASQIAGLGSHMGVIRAGRQSPIEPGSFFQSSSDVKVSGGQFTSSRHHHTNFTINVNPYSEIESSVQVNRTVPPYRDTSPPIEAQEFQTRGNVHNGDTNSEVSQETQGPSESGSLRVSRSSLPVQKSSAIYYRHLAPKGRGSPLWIPEPSDMLPIEYQKNGIGIGDVGILTDYGSFDFLFNICAPANDPINPEEMPEGFYPLKTPKPVDVDGHLEFKSNSYLASSLVESSQRDGESPGLIFESSASDGAVLTMPNGSRSRDLGNVINFRKYAYVNAEKWYKYANEVRGREARNGDLRLVVGYNTSNAWGMATFANISASADAHAHAKGNQSAFRLKFKPMGENSLGRTYGWEYSGMAEVKSGPDSREVERLRSGGDSDRRGVGGDPTLAFENQCLFVRTMNVTLQDDVWDKLSAEWAGLYLDDDDSWQPSTQDSLSPFGSNGSDGVGSAGSGPGFSSRDSTSSSSSSQGVRGNLLVDSTRVFTPRRKGSRKTAHLSDLPVPLDLHPSKMINKLLLQERSSMKMAITEDKDWISVLDTNENGLPSSETIFSRLMATHDICEDEGAVFLQPKNTQPLQLGDGQYDAAANHTLMPFPLYDYDDVYCGSIVSVDQAGLNETLDYGAFDLDYLPPAQESSSLLYDSLEFDTPSGIKHPPLWASDTTDQELTYSSYSSTDTMTSDRTLVVDYIRQVEEFSTSSHLSRASDSSSTTAFSAGTLVGGSEDGEVKVREDVETVGASDADDWWYDQVDEYRRSDEKGRR